MRTSVLLQCDSRTNLPYFQKAEEFFSIELSFSHIKNEIKSNVFSFQKQIRKFAKTFNFN